MRKIISVLLSLVMIFSSVCFSTAYGAESETALYESSIPLLNVLDVRLPAQRADDEFITRGEFVYLMMNAANMKFDANAEYLEFPDVKLDMYLHDEVVLARALGIVTAKADESFGINDYITADYAAKTVLALLGFTNIQKDGNTLNSASMSVYNDLVNEVTSDRYLSFEDGEAVIYQMLLSPFVEIDGFGDDVNYTISRNKLFLESVYGVVKYEGRITGNQFTKFGGGKTDENQIELDGIIYNSICGDVSEYLGYLVEFYMKEVNNKDTVICIKPDTDNKVTVIKSGELTDVSRSGSDMYITYYEEEKDREKRITIPFSSDFIYNGEARGISTSLFNELITAKDGEIEIIENHYGKTLKVLAYQQLIVSSVSQTLGVIYGEGNELVNIPDNTYDNVQVFKGNEKLDIADIKKGDFIMIAASGEYCKIIISDNIVVGIVEQFSNDEIVIDGVKYQYSNQYKTSVKPLRPIKLNLEANFYFNTYGKLVDYDDKNIVKSGEYVFLVDSGIDNSSALVDKGMVRVVNMNGEMQDYPLAKKVFVSPTGGSNNRKLPSEVIALITGMREVVYIEKNINDEVYKLFVGEPDSDYITKDAAELLRKYKRGAGALLVDTNDNHFPEFYITADTIVLQVPVSTASDSEFSDPKNYRVINISSEVKDAENITVEAYNFDDFNVAGIMLLKKQMTVDISKDGKLFLVDSIGTRLNDSGEAVPVVYGYSGGAEVTMELESEAILNAALSNPPEPPAAQTKKIQKGDIVRFFAIDGVAAGSQYIKNINNDFAVMTVPEGINNGNAYVIGYVEAVNDKYIKLRMSDDTTMVFFGVKNPIIYNSANGKSTVGTIADIGYNQLVMMRVYYTGISDIIIKN